MPSVEEGITSVVLEAMAVGVLVISANCGGMQEVIEDGHNGWLVPVRDAGSLAKAIIHFRSLNDENLSLIQGNARETISNRFLLNHQVKAMKAFYEWILSDENSGKKHKIN